MHQFKTVSTGVKESTSQLFMAGKSFYGWSLSVYSLSVFGTLYWVTLAAFFRQYSFCIATVKLLHSLRLFEICLLNYSSTGAIISLRCYIYPPGGGHPRKIQKLFSQKSVTVPKVSHSTHSVSLYHAKSTTATSKLPIIFANLNTLSNTLGFRPKPKSFRQPITIEHEKPLNFVS